MKIILSESQIKSLKESLLLETTDDVFTYTTKYKQIMWNISNGQINEYDYIQMPVGTKFKISKNASTISAWNGLINFECNTRNFYDTKKSKTYINKSLSGALSDKFCYKGKIKNSVEGAYWAKKNTGIGTQDTECVKKITPIYKRAVYWWKQRFSDPSFINKLKTVNKYTDQQVKAWIVKYKNYLDNNISGPFCPTDNSYIDSLNAMAYAQGYGSGYHEIVYNS